MSFPSDMSNMGGDHLELKEYLFIIRKRFWIIIVFVVIAVFISGIVSVFVLDKVYEAYSTLMVVKEKSDQSSLEYNDILLNQRLVKTYSEVAKSNRVLSRVDEELGLNIPISSLAELIKAPCFGQIFVSRTKPGITRGNHYHHTKTEKFMVVQGEGIIRLRQINGDDVIEYVARGEDYRVVDIPPGYTHSIENTGNNEMVTLFWSSEVFDPEHTDTYFEPVLSSE